MSPSSNELFREINRTVYPPEQVHRYFEFRNGIPAEYYSFIDCEDDRNEKEHTFDQTASVAAWIAVAIEEQKLAIGHALLCPSHFVS